MMAVRWRCGYISPDYNSQFSPNLEASTILLPSRLREPAAHGAHASLARAQPTQLRLFFVMPATTLLLLVPMAAAAVVAPAPVDGIRSGVRTIGRRSLVLGTAAALLAPIPAARAEAPVKTTDYKGFNLFGEGSAERCENGQGAACAQLADGSELILQLQEQSRTNTEKRARWSAKGPRRGVWAGASWSPWHTSGRE